MKIRCWLLIGTGMSAAQVIPVQKQKGLVEGALPSATEYTPGDAVMWIESMSFSQPHVLVCADVLVEIE